MQYLFLLLFVVTFILLFLNILLARRYLKEDKINNHKYKMNAVKWLSAMLLIINVSAFSLLESANFGQLFMIEILAATAGGLIIGREQRLSENNADDLSNRQNYIRSFSSMILTGLIITSGIPVAFFYVTSYNYEQNLGIRHRQTDYANRLLDQRTLVSDTGSNATLTYDTSGIHYDNMWISELPSVKDYDSSWLQDTITYESIKTRKLLGAFRLAMGDKTVKTDKLHITYAADTSIIYQPLQIHATPDSNTYTYMKTRIADKYLKMGSYKLNYFIPELAVCARFYIGYY